MYSVKLDENAPILIEFPAQAGVQQASRSTKDIMEQSTKAFDNALSTICNVARRLDEAINTLVDQPSQIEVEFGIKITAESGAIIAKAGCEGALNVRLTWDNKIDK